MQRILILLLALLAAGCSESTPTSVVSDEPVRALFIGSSFLAYGETDVVDTLAAMATRGGKQLLASRRVLSGYRLERHAQDALTLAVLDSAQWDVVVLQGSGLYLAKSEWHDQILPHLASLAAAARQRSPDVRVLYMMPWAFKDGLTWMEGETATYEQMQAAIDEASLAFVDSLDIGMAPVGRAWKQVIDSGYENDLFFADQSHQSVYGAYLTACVLYCAIFEEPVPDSQFISQDDLLSYPPLEAAAARAVFGE